MSQVAPPISALRGEFGCALSSQRCCCEGFGIQGLQHATPVVPLKRAAHRPLRGVSFTGNGFSTKSRARKRLSKFGLGKFGVLRTVSAQAEGTEEAFSNRQQDSQPEVLPTQLSANPQAPDLSSHSLVVSSESSEEVPNPHPPLLSQLASKLKTLSRWQKTALLGVPALPAIFAGYNFDGPTSVIQALVVLGGIVTFHECGHFLAARLQNIPVSQFVIGFGPTLAEWKGKEVDYKLKALPLGGYVAFPDEDPGSNFAQDDPRLLKNRPLHQRALVISAGVIANAILAYAVLFAQVQTVGYTEQRFLPGVVVGQVIENSSARKGGVHRGDIIMSIDQQPIRGGSGSTSELVEAIKQRPEKEILLEISRGGKMMDLRLKADRDIDGAGRIGVQLRANDEISRRVVRNTWRALELASLEWQRLTGVVLDGLRQIFFNFGGTADKLSGPVAIVALGADVARNDVTGLFQFAALININLAVVNLLPLPALDGGYLALLVVEGLRGGKKLPDGLEQRIMASGLLLLLSLGLFLTVKDTLNLDFIKDLLGV